MHFRVARAGLKVLGCKEMLRVFGVVGNDIGAQHHFAPRLLDELSHLERHRDGELIDTSVHNFRGFRHYYRALREALVPPCIKAGCGGCGTCQWA